MTELSRLWDYVGRCGTMWDYGPRPGLQDHQRSWDFGVSRSGPSVVNGNSKSVLKRCGAMTTAFRSVQKLIFEAARRTVPKKANILWSTAFKTRLAERNITRFANHLPTIKAGSGWSGWSGCRYTVPSGKHTKNYGKSPSLIGKSTINGSFSIAILT